MWKRAKIEDASRYQEITNKDNRWEEKVSKSFKKWGDKNEVGSLKRSQEEEGKWYTGRIQGIFKI